jgi:hypothetical protein
MGMKGLLAGLALTGAVIVTSLAGSFAASAALAAGGGGPQPAIPNYYYNPGFGYNFTSPIPVYPVLPQPGQ